MQAAILQQTAQYIVTLEREKTQLLNQVCQLKRIVDQQDGSAVGEMAQTQATQPNGAITATATTNTMTSQAPNLKKRKLDTIYTMQAISDSSDEGLGSMSPEPNVLSSQTSTTTISNNIVTKQTTVSPKEFIEMKNALENERRKTMALEEQLRQHRPVYATRSGDAMTNGSAYSHDVIEHTTDNIRHTDDENGSTMRTVLVGEKVHVLTIDSLQNVGPTQVVMCSEMDDDIDMVDGSATTANIMRGHNDGPFVDDDDSRTMSPLNSNLVKDEYINDSRPQSPLESTHPSTHPTLKVTNAIRLQPILEAAIKAEPKVEVERIHSPGSITVLKENNVTRVYPTNTSRQNLETIVEAIRHLEGDHMFGDMIESVADTAVEQEVPLALTNKPHQHTIPVATRQIQIDANSFMHFRSSSSATTPSHIQHSPLLQAQLQHPKTVVTVPAETSTPITIYPTVHSINNRPGVIVVKQNS